MSRTCTSGVKPTNVIEYLTTLNLLDHTFNNSLLKQKNRMITGGQRVGAGVTFKHWKLFFLLLGCLKELSATFLR